MDRSELIASGEPKEKVRERERETRQVVLEFNCSEKSIRYIVWPELTGIMYPWDADLALEAAKARAAALLFRVLAAESCPVSDASRRCVTFERG